MMKRILVFALLPLLLAGGCDKDTADQFLEGITSADVGSNGLAPLLSGPRPETPRRPLRDVISQLFGAAGQPVPGAGFFDAVVINESSAAAEVTLQFFLVERLVHETFLHSVAPGTTVQIAGPEMATLLVANSVSATGVRHPERRFVFGVDMDRRTPAVYRIADPVIEPEQVLDAGTNAPAAEEVPVEEIVNVETTGAEEVGTTGIEETGGGANPPPPPPPPPDCNGNQIDDGLEVAQGSAADCNGDDIPDECQLGADCNSDGVPDDCQLQPDCNSNAVPDDCDIAGGTSADCDGNGEPDECQDLSAQCPGVDLFFLADPNAFADGLTEGLCSLIDELISGFGFDMDVVVVGFMVPTYLHDEQVRLSDLAGHCAAATSLAVQSDLNGPGTGPYSTPSIEGDADGCPGTIIADALGTPGTDRNWGPAAAVIAAQFSGWTEGYAHVIVPIIAEAPCLGGTDGECDAGDEGALATAVAEADSNGVVIAPILTSNGAECLKTLLAAEAIAYVTTTEANPGRALATAILPCCVTQVRYSCSLRRTFAGTGCFEDPRGAHATLADCLRQCAIAWDCDPDLGCVETPGGPYATWQECYETGCFQNQ